LTPFYYCSGIRHTTICVVDLQHELIDSDVLQSTTAPSTHVNTRQQLPWLIPAQLWI